MEKLLCCVLLLLLLGLPVGMLPLTNNKTRALDKTTQLQMFSLDHVFLHNGANTPGNET